MRYHDDAGTVDLYVYGASKPPQGCAAGVADIIACLKANPDACAEVFDALGAHVGNQHADRLDLVATLARAEAAEREWDEAKALADRRLASWNRECTDKNAVISKVVQERDAALAKLAKLEAHVAACFRDYQIEGDESLHGVCERLSRAAETRTRELTECRARLASAVRAEGKAQEALGKAGTPTPEPAGSCANCKGSGIVAGAGEYTSEPCPECKKEWRPLPDPLKTLPVDELRKLMNDPEVARGLEEAVKKAKEQRRTAAPRTQSAPFEHRCAGLTRAEVEEMIQGALQLFSSSFISTFSATVRELLPDPRLAQAVALVNEARGVVFDLQVCSSSTTPGASKANARAEDWCRRAQEFDILHGGT